MKTLFNHRSSLFAKISCLALILSLSSYSLCLGQAYQKGDNLLNLGVGIGGTYGMPIGLSFEHGFSDKISGGVYLGYASKEENFGFAAWKWMHLLGVARASYHFNFNVENLGPYAGVILGYNYAKGEWSNGAGGNWATPSAGGVVYGGHVGARYLFSSSFGIFAELGYGLGNVNAGITFKL